MLRSIEDLLERPETPFVGEFIRAQLSQAGFDKVLLGLSGGIDSALVAYLSAEAIGPANVLAILMPYKTSSPESRGDAETIVEDLSLPHELVDISAIVDGYFDETRSDAAPLRRGNFMARARMMVLYDHSVTWGGLVIGTGNKTELLIGYSTLWGDSASAFNPIGDLYKSQVRQLSVAVGVPEVVITKAPSADLWPGQTDEDDGGGRATGNVVVDGQHGVSGPDEMRHQRIPAPPVPDPRRHQPLVLERLLHERDRPVAVLEHAGRLVAECDEIWGGEGQLP